VLANIYASIYLRKYFLKSFFLTLWAAFFAGEGKTIGCTCCTEQEIAGKGTGQMRIFWKEAISGKAFRHPL